MASSIRLASEDDAGAIAAIYRPYVEATPISFETVPPDEPEMRRRIAETLVQYPWLVYEAGGHVAGFAYAAKHRVRAAYQWSVDTAVYVDGTRHRSGIGRSLYASLFPILSAQGFFNAYAGITLPNAGSVGLHESVGFTPVGVYREVGYKLGAWHDVGWWQLTLRERTDEPPPPTALAAILKTRVIR
jgi:L-amino acid N-acyltransferase YncA